MDTNNHGTTAEITVWEVHRCFLPRCADKETSECEMVHWLLGSLLGLVAVGEFSFIGFEDVVRKLVVHHIFLL